MAVAGGPDSSSTEWSQLADRSVGCQPPSRMVGNPAMATDALAAMDATAQAELVRRGEATPLELVDAAIARIERLDPTLKASCRGPSTRREARRARARPDGPFLGVPFLMKDIGGQEAGAPYHTGMKVLKRAGWGEPEDATSRRSSARSGLRDRSAAPARPSWRCCRPPSRRPTGRRATRGTRSTARAARAAARRRRSRRAWCRPRTRATAAARSGFRLRTAASWVSSRRAAALVRPGAGERWSGFSV